MDETPLSMMYWISPRLVAVVPRASLSVEQLSENVTVNASIRVLKESVDLGSDTVTRKSNETTCGGGYAVS